MSQCIKNNSIAITTLTAVVVAIAHENCSSNSSMCFLGYLRYQLLSLDVKFSAPIDFEALKY